MEVAMQTSSLEDRFERDGFIGPVRAISAEASLELAAKFLAMLKQEDYGPLVRRNRHFDMPEVRAIATAPAVIDLLTQVYSPDVCLWRSHVFTGKAGRGLGWHADYFRTLLDDPLDHLTMHFALTEATDNNCVMVIPGSHKWSADDKHEHGFELIVKTEDSGYGTPYYIRNGKPVEIRRMVLQPGEFFIFDPGLMHASLDAVGDKSNASPALAFVKGMARKLETRLNKLGAVADPSRLAIGFRFCDPRNAISPAAFNETEGMGHKPVSIAGRLPDGFVDWRAQA